MAVSRRARKGARASSGGLRPKLVLSAVLHLGIAALALLAALRREKPPEPLPPPSYAVEFMGGAPDQPAEQEAEPDADAEETPPPDIPQVEPPQEAQLPEDPSQPQSAPEIAEAPPEEPPAPVEPQQAPEVAEAPPAPEEPTTAEAEDLPVPPPAAPPRPQREAALTAPPRPARPPQPERLPGLYLPDTRFNPAPPRPPAQRRGLDLSPGQLPRTGRDTPEAEVRGAKVGPDWRNAFRRWLEDHKRYPENARVVGEEGTNRIEMIVDPDGRVRSARLLRRSGSVWLDAGTMSLFRNAKLPPFPPGADPSGVTVDLTINYILIR